MGSISYDASARRPDPGPICIRTYNRLSTCHVHTQKQQKKLGEPFFWNIYEPILLIMFIEH